MEKNGYSTLLAAFRGLQVSSRPVARRLAFCPSRNKICPATTTASRIGPAVRCFSTTAHRDGSWLEPNILRTQKMRKGRPRVATGGSVKGTTVVWGDYGLRMWDHHRRISAKQLSVAEKTIKERLRGQKYRLYTRVACNVGVFVKGNDMRMGKGKGSFDHWAARVAVNQIIFELRGLVHEQIVRDAFRLAGNKLPGQYEFVKKGEAAVVGITKLDNITMEELKRPRKKLPAAPESSAPSTVSTTPTSVPAGL